MFGVVGDLDQAAVEEVCEGNFIDLRKAFFLLMGPEAPLVAKVCNYNNYCMGPFRTHLLQLKEHLRS